LYVDSVLATSNARRAVVQAFPEKCGATETTIGASVDRFRAKDRSANASLVEKSTMG
jgi:hypothetical protein